MVKQYTFKKIFGRQRGADCFGEPSARITSTKRACTDWS